MTKAGRTAPVAEAEAEYEAAREAAIEHARECQATRPRRQADADRRTNEAVGLAARVIAAEVKLKEALQAAGRWAEAAGGRG